MTEIHLLHHCRTPGLQASGASRPNTDRNILNRKGLELEKTCKELTFGMSVPTTLLRRVTGAEARLDSDAGRNIKMPVENEYGFIGNTLKLQDNKCLFLQLPFVDVIAQLE